MEILKKQIDTKIGIGILIFAFLAAALVIVLAKQHEEISYSSIIPILPVDHIRFPSRAVLTDIHQFSSEQEFKTYLAKIQRSIYGGGFGEMRALDTGGPVDAPQMSREGGQAPARISQTNVQVQGIDEPDIVKTDGKEIYFSPEMAFYPANSTPFPSVELREIPSPEGKTKLIKAFPPSQIKLDSEIKLSGNLLLHEGVLVVFSGNDIYGYDVSNPALPKEKWKIKLENNTVLADARLYENKVYLVTRNQINSIHPCPIIPLRVGERALSIPCDDIYYPVAPIPADATFIAMRVNPDSGEVEEKVSFVGSSGSSIVYMSPNAIYITYSYYESLVTFLSNFLEAQGRDLIPGWLLEKIEKLTGYEISELSKLTELQIVLEQYTNSLDRDEKLRVENELENRVTDYSDRHKRELGKTGIVKIQLKGLRVQAAGNVSGSLLNQFALDEYKENLRVATTIGEGLAGSFGINGRGGSENDIYVLDSGLKPQGSVQGLGLTERIYSVRFLEDKGYVVTFRQTDPFYVLDLSNPQKPALKGELKIPGFSSYLHPITKDKILGVGQENWRVKLSLFNVQDPQNPTEQAKYVLDESWSEVLSTHHAFLMDPKHSIFFLPGEKGGYIFSFENNTLELKKAISQPLVKRALFLDDYLYILGAAKITILNEMNWEKVKELEF